MAELIRDYLDLPAELPECVVKIQDFDDPELVAQVVEDYVLTETAADELAKIVRRVVNLAPGDRGKGHWVHGAFGSGKSHFMSVEGLILSDNPEVWKKQHPTIQALEKEFRAKIGERPFFVVPIYMMDFDRLQEAVYYSINRRIEVLRQRGRTDLTPIDFIETTRVFDLMRQDAERYGSSVWQRFAELHPEVQSQAEFDDVIAMGTPEEQEELAVAVLQFRGDSQAERRHLYPLNFNEGISRLKRKAKEWGYGGVIFFIDELSLFLWKKTRGQDFVAETNDLAAMVDSSGREEFVPAWVFVARHPNIREVNVKDESQNEIFTALDHHRDRFPTTTVLGSMELVEITEKRVLKRQDGRDSAWDVIACEAREGMPLDLRKLAMPDGYTPDDMLRLYPFLPATIQTLLDVSERLSRERAGIRLLYRLLIEKQPQLEAGQWMPYYTLFDAVFEPSGVYQNADYQELLDVWETYYRELLPVIEGSEVTAEDEERELLKKVVKTVLLAGLSRRHIPEVTLNRIYALNFTDMRGRTAQGPVNRMQRLLKALANRNSRVEFRENERDAGLSVVRINVESGINVQELLRRCPCDEQMVNQNFEELLASALKGSDFRGRFQNGDAVPFTPKWRGFTRPARLTVQNIREGSATGFLPTGNEEFVIVIDRPYDDEGHGSAEDESVIDAMARQYPDSFVAFWRPAFFSESDLTDLRDYARLQYLLKPYEEGATSVRPALIEELPAPQQRKVREELERFRNTRRGVLAGRLKECYLGPNRVRVLNPAVASSLDVAELPEALRKLITNLLAIKYPYFPEFSERTDPANQTGQLKRVLNDFLIKAAEGGGQVGLDATLNPVLDAYAVPLRFADRGATAWGLNKASIYLKHVIDFAQSHSQMTYAELHSSLYARFGFPETLTDLFALYLIHCEGYRPLQNGKPVDIAALDFGKLKGLELRRGRVLPVHRWATVKDRLLQAYGLTAMNSPSIPAQDALLAKAREVATPIQKTLESALSRWTTLEDALSVDPGDAHQLVNAAKAFVDLTMDANRTDSYDALEALALYEPADDLELQKWVVPIKRADDLKRAVEVPNTDRLHHIVAAFTGGHAEAQALVERGQKLVAEFPLKPTYEEDWKDWNRDAKALIDQLVGKKPGGGGGGGGTGGGGGGGGTPEQWDVLFEDRLTSLTMPQIVAEIKKIVEGLHGEEAVRVRILRRGS